MAECTEKILGLILETPTKIQGAGMVENSPASPSYAFENAESFYEEIEATRDCLRLFVPGRVCLFGEHSDWAGGYRTNNPDILPGRCIVSGTTHGVHAKVYQNPGSFHVRSVDQHGNLLGSFSCDMDADKLLEIARVGSMFSYAAGVAYNIITRYNVGGLIIDNYLTTLPVKKGLSSSAAICVLVARAFNRIYNLKLTIQGEMDLAYLGERTTPSKCGRMDQCCAFGSRPVLMTFDGDRVDCTEIAIGCELYLVLVDLCATKDTKIILNELNGPYCNANPDEKGKSLIELLGPINTDITKRAIEAIESGDSRSVGKLMMEAMKEFDARAQPVCPSQLKAPVLHKCMSYEPLQKHMLGCKGIGAGGDGSCQILAKSKEAAAEIVKIVESQLNMDAMILTIGKSREIRRAIIPTASYSHQMFPATKAISNALFPVVGPDGVAKPFIAILVEEALSSGIEEVVVIVSPVDEKHFRELFASALPKNRYKRLTPNQKRYAKKLLEMSKNIRFVVQEHQEGLGHAIFQAKDYIKKEPFLLMLGDHLYQSKNRDRSCVQQILDLYSKYGPNLIGLREVQKSDIQSYGVVTGDWMKQNRSILSVNEMVEKPKLQYADENLRTQGVSDSEFLAFFGLYALDGEAVMSRLADDISSNSRTEGGGFGLTSVLADIVHEDGVNGFILDGTCLDLGNPRTYVETLHRYSKG